MNFKKRKGAFREDRYHATAIEIKQHLLRGLAYIDLNMVRTGCRMSHRGGNTSLWDVHNRMFSQ